MRYLTLGTTILACTAAAVLDLGAQQGVALKDLMPTGMVIGVAINQRQFDGVDTTAVDLITKQFNQISPENGVLLTAAVLAVEVVYVDKATAAQMAGCESNAAAGGGNCFRYVQFREWVVPVAFVIGFTGAFFCFLRRRDRLVA